MAPDGAGSQRIVVIGGSKAEPPPPHPPAAREPHPPRAASAKTRPMPPHGWTTRRLTIAAALGAGATVLGGLVFLARFDAFGAGDSPLLAMGFGLFAIGMVVFCAALVALLGTGVAEIAERRGWASAAAAVMAPLALVWVLYAVGAVTYAIPAVLSLVLIGGLVVALR